MPGVDGRPVSGPAITKVSIHDVPVNRRRGGEIRVLLSPTTVQSTSGLFGVLRLGPGEYVSEHYHPYSEEFIYVAVGNVVVRLDGTREVVLNAGDALMVPMNVRHRVTNPGDRPAIVPFHLSPLAPRPELGHVDTEPLPAPAQPPLEVGGPS